MLVQSFVWILHLTKDMTLRILYSAMFIKEYFKVWQLALIWFTIIWCKCWEWFSYLKILFPQGSSSFSFRGCLPSGWIILLLSGVITLVSENVFLDQDNFWPTFMIHFSVGLACFCVSSYVMYIFFPFISTSMIFLLITIVYYHFLLC